MRLRRAARLGSKYYEHLAEPKTLKQHMRACDFYPERRNVDPRRGDFSAPLESQLEDAWQAHDAWLEAIDFVRCVEDGRITL